MFAHCPVGKPLLIGNIIASVLHGVHNRFEIAVGEANTVDIIILIEHTLTPLVFDGKATHNPPLNCTTGLCINYIRV